MKGDSSVCWEIPLEMHLLCVVLVFCVAAVGEPGPPPPPDISAVVAAGKVSGDKYKNLFFRLTINAPQAKFEIAPLVNTSEKRARLVQILADSAKFDERYTFGVLADTLSMYPQLQSATHYVRSVRHQLEKEGLTTVHEEFPVLVSGVPFTAATMEGQTTEGRKHFRGLFTTFLLRYILSFDVEGPSERRLNDLVPTLVHFEGTAAPRMGNPPK